MVSIWFVAIQVSGCFQVEQFVVVALRIVAVIALCVIDAVVTSHIVIVVSIVDYKWSIGGVVGVCPPPL